MTAVELNDTCRPQVGYSVHTRGPLYAKMYGVQPIEPTIFGQCGKSGEGNWPPTSMFYPQITVFGSEVEGQNRGQIGQAT